MKDGSVKKTDKHWRVDVIEYVNGFDKKYCYEHYEAVLAISDIEQGKKYKIACEACPRFGKNLACPPYSPSFLGFIEGAKTAKVICIRLPTDYFDQPTSEERYRACFRMARGLLVEELLRYREDGYTIAGSGTCLACDVLKVPHHGHPGGTSPAFARATGARLAVISCGAKYFERPDSATAAMLEEQGMTVLSTMSDGAVNVRLGGPELRAASALAGPGDFFQ